jgi:hypothetical protein
MLNMEKYTIDVYQMDDQIGWFGSITSVSWPIRNLKWFSDNRTIFNIFMACIGVFFSINRCIFPDKH